MPDDRILKLEAETGCLCMCLWLVSEYTRHGWDRAFFSSQRRDSHACIYSEIHVWMCRRVWPTYNALQHWHVNWYTTCHLRAIGILPWDHMLCISSRVNDVAHCWPNTPTHSHMHVSQSIWESRLWLEKNARSQSCLVLYSLTNICTNTQSPLLISKSYHQAFWVGSSYP
jgi:hypothetical protein